jgi:lysophospholipase L1-like esterase
MIRFFPLLTVLLISCSPLKKYPLKSERWENDIKALEYIDNQEICGQDCILFVGSSSIRLWKNIKSDMSPYEVLGRGYGGAHFYDLIHYTERLVKNHNPKAIAVFVANDITGKNNGSWYGDLRPKQVLQLFKFFTKEIQSIHGDIPIFAIETTPTISRWSVWDKISTANDLIKDYTAKKENLDYITTRLDFLDSKGYPKEKYFMNDKLHLNKSGYKLWAKIIKNSFKEKL